MDRSCAGRVWQLVGDGIRIRVRVQPRSSRNRIAGVYGDAIKLSVTAPPVDGAANTAVIALLADVFDVPKGAVAIVAGRTSRDKVVQVTAPRSDQLITKLESALARVDKGGTGD